MTHRDLINRALKLANVLESGEQPSYEDANDSFQDYCDMLASMNRQRLMIYEILRSPQSILAGTATYSIGLAYNFNIDRPERIEACCVKEGDLEIPVQVLKNVDEWNAIPLKTTQNIYPSKLYYDRHYPSGNISFYPTPSANKSIILSVWSQLPVPASLDTVVSFPQGYARMLRYNLAVELGASFNAPISDLVRQIAVDSKAEIKSLNIETSIATTDTNVLGGSGRGHYNILTDGY